jgi:hypothetical protein
MQQEEVVKVGDAIECFEGHRAVIEKIKMISMGEFIERYKYDGTDAYNVMLILKDGTGIIKLCFKNAPKKIIKDDAKCLKR